MAVLKAELLLLAGLAWTGASGLVFSVAAQSTTPPPPQSIYDKPFEVLLDVVKTDCGGTVTSRIVPPFPASGIKLSVGDTYEISPQYIVAQTSVLEWSGRWRWEESCGKNGRDKCPQVVPRVATSSAIYGDNVKVIVRQVGGDGRTDQLGLTAISVVVEKPALLQLGVTVGNFPKPDNPKPHRDASETVKFCAAVPVPQVRIANVRIRIIRRFQ